MVDLAKRPNIVVKVGGLGMAMGWFDFYRQPTPPGSQALADAFRPWVETCIELFGVDRCMFESNFPVDKITSGYGVLWKRLQASGRGGFGGGEGRTFCWDGEQGLPARLTRRIDDSKSLISGGLHASSSSRIGPRTGDRAVARRVGADSQGRHAFRRQGARSDLERRLYHPKLRLHGLRHAVRHGREVPGEAADGRQLHDQRRRAHLDLQAARRAGVARRPAGDRGGLRGLAQALGGARCHGPEAGAIDPGLQDRRSEDIPDPAQGQVRPAHQCHRQAVGGRTLHDAQADRRDGSFQADR